MERLDWTWQSLDGTQIKAPFGGGATGANPVERRKRGTKRSQLREGHGLPLSPMQNVWFSDKFYMVQTSQ